MSIIEALIFGVVQGITEFLPVSSTAHLVITQLLLGYEFPGLAFEIFLHLSSVLAVLVYFRKDLNAVLFGFFAYFSNRSPQNLVHFRFGMFILVATFITGLLGVLLSGFIGTWMKTPPFIAAALATTGLALIFIEYFHRYGSRLAKDMTWSDSVIVGLGQTIAVLPGISRAGSTLIAALLAGLDRDTAVRYSFLLAVPVILGSSVLALKEVDQEMWRAIGAGPLAVSFLATFVFSWLGIVWLIDFLKKSKLVYFAAYLFLLALFVYFFFDSATIIEIVTESQKAVLPPGIEL
jgi:undecaprenyl-diphosphatase